MTRSEERARPCGLRPRVLLLTFARRGEEEAIRRAMEALRTEFAGAQITAVGTPVSAPVLSALGAAHVIVYGEGHGARDVVQEIASCQASAAAIVYGGPGLSGHLKLELLAVLSRARRVRRFTPDGAAGSIGRLGILCSVWAKASGSLLRLVAGGMVCATAFCFLRTSQLLVGGHRAGRA